MKKIVKWIMMACLTLMCTACDDNGPLTYEQMLEDYDYLWTTIQENYAMMNVAQRMTGKNFLAVKDHYRNKITEDTTTQQFDSYVSLFLNEFEGIGKMEKLNAVSYKRLYEKLKDSASMTNSLNYLYDVINNGKSKSYYDFEDTELSDEDAEKNLITSVVEKDRIAYIKMSDMDQNSMKEDGKTLKKFFKEIKNYPVCVIDLRGVTSGVEQYWIENIVAPNISEKTSYETLALVKGGLAKEYMSTEYQLLEIRKLASLPALQLKDLEGMTDYVKSSKTIAPAAKKAIFKGDFYAMIDGSTADSAERFAMFCKQSDFATLVGDYSGGASSLEPLLIKLPNSGMIIRMSADHHLNLDGASNAEYGTAPDIRIESENLYGAVMAKLRELYPAPVEENQDDTGGNA